MMMNKRPGRPKGYGGTRQHHGCYAASAVVGATNLLPLEGGLPLMRGGKIVGAIVVSGMQSQQDVQVAQAGADARLLASAVR